MILDTKLMNLGRTKAAVATTCSWVSGSSSSGIAMSVMQEIPSTFIPPWTATIVGNDQSLYSETLHDTYRRMEFCLGSQFDPPSSLIQSLESFR